MGTPTVLVVDDERSIADLYQIYLQDKYDVRVAYGGEEAIDRIDEDVDVVLLDRNMPDQTGDEVLKVIRRENFAARVAMVTAVDPDFNIITMEFDDYLVKPVSKAELLTVVDRLVTMSSVDSAFQEYAALAAKHTTLQEEMSDAELAASDEFAALKDRLKERNEEVNELLAEFTGNNVEILLPDAGTPTQSQETALIDCIPVDD